MILYIEFNTMNPYLIHLTDRELLEKIYVLLLQVYQKIDQMDDDNKEFGLNLAADLMGDMLQNRVELNNRVTKG